MFLLLVWELTLVINRIKIQCYYTTLLLHLTFQQAYDSIKVHISSKVIGFSYCTIVSFILISHQSIELPIVSYRRNTKNRMTEISILVLYVVYLYKQLINKIMMCVYLETEHTESWLMCRSTIFYLNNVAGVKFLNLLS